ncbi:MAG: hypothetical protein HY898_30875 [Deltaproteobacteria bacterium]|nr:hypothetical protein [Deltaproteobacteria bacterium]
MRPTWTVGFFAVACILAGVSCAGLGATEEAGNPDSGQTPGTTQGTVGTLCSDAIDACGWTALDCSSDPDCAHWYGCVLDCHPVHGLTGCLDECAAGQPSSLAATALHKCLGSAGSSACGSDPEPGVKADVEAGADNEAGETPFYASCADCVWGSCQAVITSCSSSTGGECLSYKSVFEKCAGASSRQDFEKCLLDAEKESSAAHDKFSTSGSLACIVDNCSKTCVPADYQSCIECSRGKCADALDAWLQDSIAQDLSWCRNGCKGASECITACKDQYGEGAGVLSALIACQSQACPACGI